jgi:DNA-binding MarR family transcriptional regulator
MSALDARPRAEPASKARLRLWLRLLRITRGVESELREKLRRDHATTLPRFDVMAALSRHAEGLKMSELSGVLRVSNGNVTGIIDRLVEEGHVLRVAVEGDRRASVVQLTAKGAREFARQAAEHEAWIDAALSEIAPADAQRVTEILGAIGDKRE